MLLGELSLRSKLAGLLVAASVIPLGISAFFDIREMRERGIKEAEALLAARAEQIAREIDSTHIGYWREYDSPPQPVFCFRDQGSDRF